MSSPRLRRLQLDQERLQARFQNWPAVQITGMTGTPAEQYEVTYHVRGLYSTPSGQILESDRHVVTINLSLGYPRRAPQCKMLTPIFHPNFDEVSVCIGDFWAASEGLDDLIVRIGRMISYQEYNTKSPLNGLAAKWAAQHSHMLPVDRTELAPPLAHSSVEESEKLVVQLEGSAAFVAPVSPYAPSHDSYQPPATEPEPTPEPVATPAPRLDFGMIAVCIQPGYTSIGRAPDNIIQLLHESVSSRHAEVLSDEGRFVLRDLASTNGTTQNNLPIKQTVIYPGDRICFGDLEAEFLC